jgi:hypothetical protein
MKNYFKISGFYSIGTLILFSTLSITSKTTTCTQRKVMEQPTIAINITEDGHVAAYVKNDKRYENTLFALQMKDKPSFKSPILLDNCNVVVGKNYFIFSSKKTGNQVVFKLAEAQIKGELSKTAITFEGYGLIKNVNPKEYRNMTTITKGLFPAIGAYNCKCEENGSKSPCDSGGTGATDCSAGSGVAGVSTSCQVSCGGGYFACCNDQ